MVFISRFLAAAAAAVAVSASPLSKPMTLALKQVNTVKNIKNLVKRDQQRLAEINQLATGSAPQAHSGPATNEDVTYVAPIKIGGKTYQLIVDTGSSNTWCGARTSCEPSATGRSTGGYVSVTYGSGSFSGTEYIDTMSYAGLTVKNQSIGSADSSSGFSGVDGIVGFGPVDLTRNTVSNAATVPTFMDNLYHQHLIPTELLGVHFAPESGSDTNDANGELTLGGTDPNKYTGSLKYYPRATTGAVAPYWGIAIANFKYGSTTLASNVKSIVDTGTTLIIIPATAYNAFLKAAKGRTGSSGLPTFTTKPTQNFIVTFGTTSYALTPNQYLIPQAQYANFGLANGKYYAWIANGGSGSVSCIIGQKFLENYYSAYDTTHSRIGFAPRA